MKKTISILAILLFSMTFAFAQNATNKPVDASTPAAVVNNPNAADISFTKLVHDYGTIFVGGDGNCEFEFTNTGKEPLILSNVKSSCGCTVPSWPKEPILPGKKETIKVKYDTNRIGPINKTITVSSNAKNDPVVLKITGNIVKKAEDNTTPEKTLNSGAAPTAK
ncbi:MAG: DUF1573 domain-containing protein [Chloroflexota bacterium]|nr:DUF1573 domain-containing protein [Lentimicrobium sp.]